MVEYTAIPVNYVTGILVKQMVGEDELEMVVDGHVAVGASANVAQAEARLVLHLLGVGHLELRGHGQVVDDQVHEVLLLDPRAHLRTLRVVPSQRGHAQQAALHVRGHIHSVIRVIGLKDIKCTYVGHIFFLMQIKS